MIEGAAPLLSAEEIQRLKELYARQGTAGLDAEPAEKVVLFYVVKLIELREAREGAGRDGDSPDAELADRLEGQAHELKHYIDHRVPAAGRRPSRQDSAHDVAREEAAVAEKPQAGDDPIPARERLIDRIGTAFHDLDVQLSVGLPELLEGFGVALEVRVVVREYMDAVVQGLDRLEAEVVKLADLMAEKAVGFDPASDFSAQEHGHATLASLFAEIRADEAAGRREGSHGPASLRDLLGSRREEPAREPERETGIER